MQDLDKMLKDCEVELKELNAKKEKTSSYITDMLRDRGKLFGRLEVLEQRLTVLKELKEENIKEEK